MFPDTRVRTPAQRVNGHTHEKIRDVKGARNMRPHSAADLPSESVVMRYLLSATSGPTVVHSNVVEILTPGLDVVEILTPGSRTQGATNVEVKT